MNNKCPDCGGPMLALFTSIDCRDKCYDKPKAPSKGATTVGELNALMKSLYAKPAWFGNTAYNPPVATCLHDETYGFIGTGKYFCKHCGTAVIGVGKTHYDQGHCP